MLLKQQAALIRRIVASMARLYSNRICSTVRTLSDSIQIRRNTTSDDEVQPRGQSVKYGGQCPGASPDALALKSVLVDVVLEMIVVAI